MRVNVFMGLAGLLAVGLLTFSPGCMGGSDNSSDTPSKDQLLQGKADGVDVCAVYGFPSNCDPCLEFGWYGDGSCDWKLIAARVCKGPDPDCGQGYEYHEYEDGGHTQEEDQKPDQYEYGYEHGNSCDAGSSCWGDGGGLPEHDRDSVCCQGQHYHGYVKGVAFEFPAQTPIAIQLAPVTLVGALSGTPPHLDEVKSATDGTYQTACFDMTSSTKGIMMLSDDDSFDGTTGDWYPTVSGVIDTSDPVNKTCEEAANPVFGIRTALVNALSTATYSDFTTKGFAVIRVLDINGKTPVGGAVLKDTYGNEIITAIYPNATLDDFSGTSTADGIGLILVPGDGSPLLLIEGAPVKDGLTWSSGLFAIVKGFAISRPFVAE